MKAENIIALSKVLTIDELIENGRKVAEQISSGTYPEGTEKADWMIVNGVAVYTPYVPLYQTCDLV